LKLIHSFLNKVPPRWIVEPTDKAFAQGSEAKIECKADGFPKPQISWKKAPGKSKIERRFKKSMESNEQQHEYLTGSTPNDYRDIRSNNYVRIEDGTLSIGNIQKSSEGYYLCEASNGIGVELSAVIFVNVQGNWFIDRCFLILRFSTEILSCSVSSI
jgi:Down syndrome cell adhesion protein 1